MDTGKYQEYLEQKEISDIEKRMSIIKEFQEYRDNSKSINDSKTIVCEFANILIRKKMNTLVNFSFLTDFAEWAELRPLHVAFIELTDCNNAFEVLSEKIENKYGVEMKQRIFEKEIPPLGSGEKQRSAYACYLTEKMEKELSSEEMKKVWYQVQHGIPDNFWKENDKADIEKYANIRNIDVFLDMKRKIRDELLTKLNKENRLWYTVEITDEVLEYVKNDPEMEAGIRFGNKVFISKIPYNSVKYLKETDDTMKRYYACHCPLVREAILNKKKLSPEICNCSLGHASHYLAGPGKELKGTVLESALKGDLRCRFEFEFID
jgi:hypothetical protein